MSSTDSLNSSSSAPDLAVSIGKNTLFGVLANITQVLTRLLTVPIVIHYLGLDGYGIWNIIMMTATYMRFGSVGIKTAFQKYVAEATGTGNYEEASRLLSTGCACMLVLSIAALIPIAISSTTIAKFAGIPEPFQNSSAGAISLLAVIMAMSNVGATFEAIVMGGHRIDLVRKCGTVLTLGEAVALVAVLHFGRGLYSMAAVMGASELIYICYCFIASRRVVKEIRIGPKFFSRAVIYELVRFAGSYQLVNILEVVYVSLIPFAVLKAFGANLAGVFAVVTRVVTSAGVLQDAFLSPILSGGAMVYASGSHKRMQELICKAFKVTLGLSLFPLGFIGVFGPTMAYAWTGERSEYFRIAFYIVCGTALFRAFSLLGLVLYRISGRALLDNIRQVLRIGILLIVVLNAHRLGFYGVLIGMACAELAGMIFMLIALTRTFILFRAKSLLPDIVRLSAAAMLLLSAGVVVTYIPLPIEGGTRVFATIRLLEIISVCLLLAWPLLLGTGSVTLEEGRKLRNAIFPAHVR